MLARRILQRRGIAAVAAEKPAPLRPVGGRLPPGSRPPRSTVLSDAPPPGVRPAADPLSIVQPPPRRKALASRKEAFRASLLAAQATWGVPEVKPMVEPKLRSVPPRRKEVKDSAAVEKPLLRIVPPHLKDVVEEVKDSAAVEKPLLRIVPARFKDVAKADRDVGAASVTSLGPEEVEEVEEEVERTLYLDSFSAKVLLVTRYEDKEGHFDEYVLRKDHGEVVKVCHDVGCAGDMKDGYPHAAAERGDAVIVECEGVGGDMWATSLVHATDVVQVAKEEDA